MKEIEDRGEDEGSERLVWSAYVVLSVPCLGVSSGVCSFHQTEKCGGSDSVASICFARLSLSDFSSA